MRSLTDRTFFILGFVSLTILIGGFSLASAADAPQSPEQSAPATGWIVQDRGIQRGQFGGTLAPAVILPDRPLRFLLSPISREVLLRPNTEW